VRRRDLLAAALALVARPVTAQPIDPLLDAAAWRIVNDGVMGGVSTSRVEASGEALRFSGEVRLEFNGGFASMRRPYAPAPGQDATGLAVTARGDGNRYRLRVYTRDAKSGGENAFAYHAAFDTRASEVTRAELRWPQFAASFRGRPVAAPPLRFADIVAIGVMITKADHRDGRGPFALELLRLEPLH
jgi:monofunctional biosynthetic peptidoglycan transglycosylase